MANDTQGLPCEGGWRRVGQIGNAGGTRLERLDCSSRGRQRCRNALIELECEAGGGGWVRTTDNTIMSRVLYH